MKVTVIGADGFVGSAFVSYLSRRAGVDVIPVTRGNYSDAAGRPSDVVVEAACNSKKYLADQQPFEEFGASVSHRLRTLLDFPSSLSLHVSSVDVYSDLSSPDSTSEDVPVDANSVSRYGFHKQLAEQLVRHYAPRWLIVRLAGMVGPGLRKNPVYDVLDGQPLRIHPDSQYQFMNTQDVAQLVWSLIERGVEGEVYNVCGQGLISPREIAKIAGRPIDTSLLGPAERPRVVHVNTNKVRQFVGLPDTRRTVEAFVASVSPVR